MAIQLQTVITAARDRHPAFHRSRVTDAVLARALSEYQRQLMSRALRRDRAFLAQQASIIFTAQSLTGAGVGGFPAEVANDGTVSRAEDVTGFAEQANTDGGVVLVSEFVPSSFTTTSVTKTAAGWTVNAFTNAYLEVTAGKGVGQLRVITTNTATVLNWTTPLTSALDATSVVRVVSVATSVPGDVSVITSNPAEAQRVGYLIKLDATGTAFIDLTDPLTAKFSSGIPLPPTRHLLGGTVRDQAGTVIGEICLTTYAERFDAAGFYPVYLLNREVYLVGQSTDWNGVGAIDLRYVPDTPQFTALTDYFLLPQHAEPALVAHAAYVAGARVQGLDGMQGPDMQLLLAERAAAENDFLRDITSQRQVATSRVREVW